MEKTIEIDGKKVRLKSTGATPKRYKSQFGRDFFADIFKLNALTKLSGKAPEELTLEEMELIDFDVFYDIIWTLAKTADRDIPEPEEWLDSFDEFPLLEIIPQAQDLITASIQSKKKK